MQGQHRLHQGKFVPYDPSVQVPLEIRGPGVPAGSQPRALVWNGDITSTILQMTGARPHLPQDGQSMLPLASGPGEEVDPPDPLRDRAPRDDLRARDRDRRRGGRATRQHLRQEHRSRPHRTARARHRRAALPAIRNRAVPPDQVLRRRTGDVRRPQDPLMLSSVWKNGR